MMKFEKSEELKEIAEQVLSENEDIGESLDGARIEYLWCDSKKSKSGMTVYADCHKVPDREKALCDVDFIITGYKPHCEILTEKAMKILMLHELMHAVYENGKCTTRQHDLQDFRYIVEKYGVDWINN